MNAKKTGMTEDEHKAFGKLLQSVQSALNSALGITGKRYKFSGTVNVRIQAVSRAIWKLRSEMERTAYAEGLEGILLYPTSIHPKHILDLEERMGAAREDEGE